MFGWFKKKPEPIEPERQEAVAEKPEVIDDWEPTHGAWFKGTFCHCGREREPLAMSFVCPRCGHDNKWESYTARWEWETSMKVRHDRFRIGYLNRFAEEREQPWSRNAKLVRWTEDHCQIKEDTNENS